MINIDQIKVSWYCGHYVGPAKWRHGMNDWICEPDECGEEFETIEYRENWDENLCRTGCPKCGAELTQQFDGPVIIKQTNSRWDVYILMIITIILGSALVIYLIILD